MTDGDGLDINRAFELLSCELRRQAERFARRERSAIEPDSLVNEAYLRLVRVKDAGWKNREHFCADAARAMRQILVERARARNADKRGGGRRPTTLREDVGLTDACVVDVLTLHELLERLAALHPRQACIAETRL